MKVDLNEVIRVYGNCAESWSERSIFLGGYINFGYWSKTKEFAHHDRIKSSIRLYDIVVKNLSLKSTDVLLEVGCGKGAGIIKILTDYLVKLCYALDINSIQIDRARANIQKNLKDKYCYVEFLCTSCSDTKIDSNSVDKVISIEALQHFPSCWEFLFEMKRILKRDGKISVASHIPTGKCSVVELSRVLPTVKNNLENPTDILEIVDIYESLGFKDITIKSIGEYVFEGWNNWLKHYDGRVEDFSYSYYQAYLNGYIDYYIITAVS